MHEAGIGSTLAGMNKTVVALHGEGIGVEAARPMNQYADILSDIAGEVAGGLGFALSGNLGDEATRLEEALARVYRDGKALTPDQGGSATTTQMAAEVLAAYRNQR